ncbi:MAG: hypothetical protein L6R39_005777 [Caloplaca ligustica]|nr:MAG: hypothetical protein L6R39_005777 [Caloplaca ligustica]
MPPVVPTTYTTTDAHGSQTVVTSSTTLPPPPPPSTSETTYVTTNAAGSIITTARTTVVQPSTSPKPPATSVNIQSSTSATTYITTNAAGSTITTARTTVVQPSTSSKPPATSVIVQSSTNAQGSVVVSSSTSTAPVPFSSSACGGTYSDNLGNLYHVDCGLAYLYNDLPSQTVSSFEACLEACDNYVPSANHGSGAPCVAVTYGIRTGGGECYLKYNIIQTKSANGEDSAYKIGSGVMPPVSTSNAPAPASSGSSNVVSTQTSRATSASTINPTAAAQPCPYSNGQPFIDQQGTVFDIACSVDYPGNDLTNPHCDTFQECILACDNYVPSPSVGRGQDCVAATWSYGNTGGNCFLKYAIDEIRYGNPNDNSCKLHNYTIPATVSSSSVGGSRTSTTNNVPVPATTSSSSSRPATTPLSSSTSNPVPVTSTSSSSSTTPSSISGTVSCPSQNNTIYTNSFGNQYEVNCGQQISGNLAYRNAHADSFDKCVDFCDLLPGCVAVTYPGDSGDITRANCYPYTSFRAWTTTSDTGLIAARPLGGGPNTGTNYNNVTLCPSYNNNVFTDPAHRQYEIGCDQGLSGTTYLYATVLQTLEACAIYCSEYSTCVGVTFTGYVVGSRASNCFPSSTYTSVTAQVGNSTAYVLR